MNRYLKGLTVGAACIVMATLPYRVSRGAEPASKCQAVETAVHELLVMQAMKTAESISIPLGRFGITSKGRKAIAAAMDAPDLVRKLESKYDGEIARRQALLLLLAGCK